MPIGEAGLSYLGAGPWPYEDTATYAQPLRGHSIPAQSKDVELLFVTTVNGKVDLLWPKTRVEYDYGGDRYVEEISNGFSLCSPAPCRPRHE